jgi:hypothetical protein
LWITLSMLTLLLSRRSSAGFGFNDIRVLKKGASGLLFLQRVVARDSS